MRTSRIGQLQGAAKALALPCAIMVVAAEFVLIPVRPRLSFWANLTLTPLPSVLFLCTFLGPLRCSGASFGMTLRPSKGVGYWLKVALVVGVLMALGLLLIVAISGPPRDTARLRLTGADIIAWYLPINCLFSPVVEELIGRAVLCSALRTRFGPAATVGLAGGIFAAMHVAAGIASPDNLVAGFILSWAFLRSESVAVPIALHAAGNLAVGVARVFFI